MYRRKDSKSSDCGGKMSRDASGSPSVSDFYARRSVFITGGTGFMGKVLIEKLLYSCEDIDTIFILFRKSNESDEEGRFKNFLSNPVFTRVKEKRPQDLAKVVPVIGDLAEPNLGINSQDEAKLLEKVSVVFHVAAAIRFDVPLREAMQLNVEATRQVLELSRRMNQLQAFVHVSTAYRDFTSETVEEVLYPPPKPLAEVYEILEKPDLDEKEIASLMGDHPNTYTFTKALAETLVADLRGSMPVVIVRPTVVLPSKNEPFEGYVDKLQGSLTLLLAHAKGFMWTMAGSSTSVGDYIPVDYVINTMILAASKNRRSNELAVYNCATSAVNPVTWARTVQLFREEAARCGYSELPSMQFNTRSALKMALLVFVTQTAPAHLLDLALLVRGQTPKYVRMQTKLVALHYATQRFVDRSWHIRSERAQALATTLPPAVARQFPCNPADIDWDSYVPACLRGAMLYEDMRRKARQ